MLVPKNVIPTSREAASHYRAVDCWTGGRGIRYRRGRSQWIISRIAHGD
jgi:hypothetical protein